MFVKRSISIEKQNTESMQPVKLQSIQYADIILETRSKFRFTQSVAFEFLECLNFLLNVSIINYFPKLIKIEYEKPNMKVMSKQQNVTCHMCMSL